MSRVIVEADGVRRLTLKSTVACKVGELLGHDGSDWVLADAAPAIPAQFLALEAGEAGATVAVCRSGVLYETTPDWYGPGAHQYLSSSAGDHSNAVPSLSSTLTVLQRIGTALDSQHVAFDLTQRGPTLLRAEATVNPASAATDAIANLAVTVTGVLATDVVRALAPADLEAGVVCVAVTPTTNTVTLRLHNPTAGTVDGGAKTWTFLVERL
jgi:hypothetical protein